MAFLMIDHKIHQVVLGVIPKTRLAVHLSVPVTPDKPYCSGSLLSPSTL